MGEEIRKKVSCHVITYNHVNYIQKCIDGILMQKTDFDFEIIIGDDVSTDGTREIVKEYATRYPDLIKLNLRQKRGTGIPGKENFVSTLEMCTGEYISLCDGDDYWTDPLKLQKQVGFLEENRDYSTIFHKVREIDLSGIPTDNILDNPEVEKTYTLEDLANGNFIHTPSVVFRRNFEKLPSWFVYAPVGDYPLHMLNAQYGLIKYLPEEMASYRIGAGIWSSQNRIYQFVNTMFTLKFLIFNFLDKENIKAALEKQNNIMMDALADEKEVIVENSPEKIARNISFKNLFTVFYLKMKYFFR